MQATLSALVERLEMPAISDAAVIPWSSPVVSFGNLSRSKIATVGLNPSNREFVDADGKELDGASRRFHTLRSLRLRQWSEVSERHLDLMLESCVDYFARNPYDLWFKKLDYIISGTKTSYYNPLATACHLDLIPYATALKWTALTTAQRKSLLGVAGDTLALLLRESPVEVLILNGSAVVSQFQELSDITLRKVAMGDWALPRRSTNDVVGFAYRGCIARLAGVDLSREITILGFNHNIQSSFGVTRQVCDAIRKWIGRIVQAKA